MDALKSFFLTTVAVAVQFVQGLFDTQLRRRSVDLVKTFTVEAGEKGSVEVFLPKDGAFELFGYNIIHGLDGTALPAIFLRMKNSGEGSGWSNDYLPIRAIATPGAPDSPRYGFRQFWRVLSQDERILIEWDGTRLTNNVEVSIVYTGKVYGGVKIADNKVQG